MKPPLKPEIAKPEDEEPLTRFFESFVIKGSIDYKIQRPAGLFAHYRLQTDDFETWILRDRNQDILGCASLLFRKAHIEGKETTIGLASDLRISPHRHAISGWAKFFQPIVSQALEKRNASHLFSVLGDNDPTIINTLVRPRASRRNIPVYSLLRRFEIVSVVGHLPFMKAKLDTVNVKRAQIEDLEPLIDYLRLKATPHALSFIYTAEFLQRRMQTWPGFRIDSFLIAKTRSGKIVGCVAPWNNNSIQRVYVQSYHGFSDSARHAFKMGSWFNLTNRLPLPQNELKVDFLTHFYTDNPDVFEVLLEASYESRAPNTTLIYTHFFNYPKTRPPRQFVFSRTNSALYTITKVGQELETVFMHSPLEYPPELELCLI